MFHAIFARQARRSFELVNQHRFDAILASAVPDVRHRFSGDHALGGERNDAAHLRLWFERLHRLLPGLILTVTDVWVDGGLRKTTVIVRWTATATLLDGLPYHNRGIHVIKLRNRKVVSLEVEEDSQAVADALQRQARSGLTEALAPPITADRRDEPRLTLQ
jgi:ketosteroid isomerase-like protein